ncbi:L,D-transpeptidase family protein [Rhodopseudomonas sp. HC1]|uniref:L,D-transpeptidase family protein n=1 Tax=Rhodopseudomonas infernalis TaxID=2897386 RepID=UPI001EE78A58|nr:L,D-transpeptidase family protein [Rhodopseudomonas infernalis]MCG6203657.1 L,D-transpeptidase family protein [Rhodopseudomonas infernalis]
MTFNLGLRIGVILLSTCLASAAWAAELTPDAINAAEPASAQIEGDEPSPLVVRLQVLLDRAHFSPGEIDGRLGENAKKALRAYSEAQQLPSSDVVTDELWRKLAADGRPVLTRYTLTKKDVDGPFLKKLPAKLEAMKSLPRLAYTSAQEALAEKFHMSQGLLATLNPGQRFKRAGETITVIDIAPAVPETVKAQRIEVDKTRQTVKAFDDTNRLIAFYPATVGSEDKPSPSGTLKVTEVSPNPTYGYNPDYKFKGVKTTKPFEIKPGPNNPVGTMWIGLSEQGYGIHGTPEPSHVSKAESHGCVRLTNWDAQRIAALVGKGTPVEFTDAR